MFLFCGSFLAQKSCFLFVGCLFLLVTDCLCSSFSDSFLAEQWTKILRKRLPQSSVRSFFSH